VSGSGISWAIQYASLHLTPDRKPRQHPIHSVFYRLNALPAAQPTASKQSTKLKHFSRTFKDPNCIFQAPKLSTIRHILDADIQNLDCNVTLKCTVWGPTVLTNTVMIKASDRLPSSSTGDTHTSACFKIVNKCKISKLARFTFKDFSRIFKHLTCFQALSRALKFLFQIQAFSRISQACYEP